MAQATSVRNVLLESIHRGDFKEGAWLPSAEELARKHRCSPHAVRRAFRELSDRGILKSTQKKGTRVLRRPPLGRVLFMLSSDPHTNLLLHEPLAHALVNAGFEVEFQPFLFTDGPGFDQLRHMAEKDAADTVLLTLGQEVVPPDVRPKWEAFAAQFLARVAFQYEDFDGLPNSATVLCDQVAAAREVAEHLLALGHHEIGVVAGGQLGDGSAGNRRGTALAEFLSFAGARCHLYDYSMGQAADFVKQHGCTALWSINDHQAIEHAMALQRAGYRVPEDISVIGANDTLWARESFLPLTSVSLNPPAIAQAIVELIHDAFKRRADQSEGSAAASPPAKRFIRPFLVPRSSTGPVRPARV